MIFNLTRFEPHSFFVRILSPDQIWQSFLKVFGSHVGTRGSLRWLKKSPKEVLSREGICLRFWDGSKPRSRVKTPRGLTFSDRKLWDSSKFEKKLNSRYWSLRTLSHLRVSCLKKSAISGYWHVIEILSQFEVEPSQNLMHMPSRDNTSFDDFWAISRTPAYNFQRLPLNLLVSPPPYGNRPRNCFRTLPRCAIISRSR